MKTLLKIMMIGIVVFGLWLLLLMTDTFSLVLDSTVKKGIAASNTIPTAQSPSMPLIPDERDQKPLYIKKEDLKNYNPR